MADAPLTDDELIAQHKLVQELLALGHVTPYCVWLQIDLERELCRACDLDVFDHDTISRLMTELHNRAWPDARTRPGRLVAYDETWPLDVLE